MISIDDMRRVLECGREQAPAFVFCATTGMAAALSEALEKRWLVPDTVTFALTDSGRAHLAKIT